MGMGNTCKSMADSCQCMTKPTTIFTVISLQLIKINGKKKNLVKTLALPPRAVHMYTHTEFCIYYQKIHRHPENFKPNEISLIPIRWAEMKKVNSRECWQECRAFGILVKPLQYSCLENPGTEEHGGLPSMES